MQLPTSHRALVASQSQPTTTFPARTSPRHLFTLPWSKQATTTNPSTSPPAAPVRKYRYPERLLVFHAGTARVAFLNIMKLTNILISSAQLSGAYGCIASGGSLLHAAGLTATGLVSLCFMVYSTAPIIASVCLHLPASARESPDTLTRYAQSASADKVTIDIITASLIGKPRVSRMALSALHPVPKRPLIGSRFGLVNLARNTEAEDKKRRWYQYRAVARFGMHWSNSHAEQAWVWTELKRKLGVVEPRPVARKVVGRGHYD